MHTYLLIIAYLASCQYNSKVPLSNSEKSTIDESLLGEWVFMAADSSGFYPPYVVNLLAFNEKEYVGLHKGEAYKVFNTTVGDKTYLNVQYLSSSNNEYNFIRLENISPDSIQFTYLLDSLSQKFTTSSEFKAYLISNDSYIEDVCLSPAYTLYRWSSLLWDKVNLVNKTDNFEAFYLLGKLDEDDFLEMTTKDLIQLEKESKSIPIEIVKSRFSKVHLVTSERFLFKVPRYALLKLANGKYIKLRIDLSGSAIKDLTNNKYYRNTHPLKFKFK